MKKCIQCKFLSAISDICHRAGSPKVGKVALHDNACSLYEARRAMQNADRPATYLEYLKKQR